VFPIAEAVPGLPRLTIVDVGAMDIGETGSLAWQPLVDAGLARVIGFEPVEAECRRLNDKALAHQRFIPCAIGDGGTHRLRVTRYSACTSIFEPNRSFLSLFQDLEELFEVTGEFEVATRRLDDVAELRESGCDHLKLDIQGAETSALQGGTAALSRTLTIETELILTPMYRGAPRPGELDGAFRALGFMPWRYLGSGGRTLKPLQMGVGSADFLIQTLWGDAVYVRDYTRPDALDVTQWLKLAMLAHTLYEAFDLAHLALRRADALLGTSHAARYAARAAEAA
jgi:FkbM family methyltransferase